MLKLGTFGVLAIATLFGCSLDNAQPTAEIKGGGQLVNLAESCHFDLGAQNRLYSVDYRFSRETNNIKMYIDIVGDSPDNLGRVVFSSQVFNKTSTMIGAGIASGHTQDTYDMGEGLKMEDVVPVVLDIPEITNGFDLFDPSLTVDRDDDKVYLSLKQPLQPGDNYSKLLFLNLTCGDINTSAFDEITVIMKEMGVGAF